jgi:putative endonuclease
MEFIVYILFSETKNKFYIGFTSNLVERLVRHNQKSKGFTGSVNDWQVVYTENYETKETDTRAKTIRLTEIGETVLQKGIIEVESADLDFFASLDENLSSFNSNMAKLIDKNKNE